MSKRLQVFLEGRELRDIQRIAQAKRMTVAEWVGQALRAASRREPSRDGARKLAIVRAAARHAFPTGEIVDLLTPSTQDSYSRHAVSPSKTLPLAGRGRGGGKGKMKEPQ